jgi:hypothetical protein
MTPKRFLGLSTAFLVAGLVWLAAFVPVSATTMRRMDLPEVVSRADRVVHAVAVDERVYWDQEHRKIYTDTTFEVIEDLKGAGSPRVTVTMFGGTLNGWNMLIEGTPVFRTGDEVILFTSPRPGGSNNLVGFSQGVMQIVQDPETGARTARSFMPTGVTYIDSVGGRPTEVSRDPREAPLEEMKNEIRHLAESKDASPVIERHVSPIDRAEERRVP